MLSSEVNFTLDYTPKFTRDPLVWERKAAPLSNVRVKSPIQKRDIYKVSQLEIIFSFPHQVIEDDHHCEDDHRAVPGYSDCLGSLLH